MTPDYDIAYSTGHLYTEVLRNLAKAVDKRMADGYRPLGGVSIAVASGAGFCAAQAMVKEE